jgi:hypothetical protein
MYNIFINPDKIDGLIFSYHSKFKRPTHFKLVNRHIAFSNNITYLGITLDKHLTYSLHLKKKNRNAENTSESTLQTITSQYPFHSVKVINF